MFATYRSQLAVRPTRVFAGHRLGELRARLGHTQQVMARRLGISVSYLSQIESGDQPVTILVLQALARHFPADWATLDPEDDQALLVDATYAADDPSVPEARVGQDMIRRGAKQQPLLARRMVAPARCIYAVAKSARALERPL